MSSINTSVTFRCDLHDRLAKYALKKKKSHSSIVNSAVLRFLETEEEHDMELYLSSLEPRDITRLKKILDKKKGS